MSLDGWVLVRLLVGLFFWFVWKLMRGLEIKILVVLYRVFSNLWFLCWIFLFLRLNKIFIGFCRFWWGGECVYGRGIVDILSRISDEFLFNLVLVGSYSFEISVLFVNFIIIEK